MSPSHHRDTGADVPLTSVIPTTSSSKSSHPSKAKSKNAKSKASSNDVPATESEEIQRLKDKVAQLEAEAAAAATRAPRVTETVQPILKPKGEAGNNFNLISEMELDGSEEKRELFRTIQRAVRSFAIKANINLADDFRKIGPEQLLMVFKAVRQAQPYMSSKRFPNDWATAEILKQYMKNYRRYSVRKGRMMKRKDRLAAASSSSGSSSPPRPTNLPNIDDDDDNDMYD